jgi:hypothetical protein
MTSGPRTKRLLTETLWEHLVSDREADDDRDRKYRQRVRDRITDAFREFGHVYPNWSSTEVRKALEDPDVELRDGMRGVVAILYLALGQREFEELVGTSVNMVERELDRTAVDYVECNLEFHRPTAIMDRDRLRRKLSENPSALTTQEVGILMQYVDLSEDEIERLRSSAGDPIEAGQLSSD